MHWPVSTWTRRQPVAPFGATATLARSASEETRSVPRLRFLMLRCLGPRNGTHVVFRPERAKTYQPGATPRVWEAKRVPSPERAVQTADAAKLLCPFRAMASLLLVQQFLAAPNAF
jgi:hypothetical protein